MILIAMLGVLVIAAETTHQIHKYLRAVPIAAAMLDRFIGRIAPVQVERSRVLLA